MLKSLTLAIAGLTLAAMPAAACDVITSKTVKMNVCIDDTDWLLQAPQGVQEYLYFNQGETVGFTIISEKDTAPLSEYRQAILNNAAGGSDTGADGVQVVSERIENIGGKAWNVIEYQIGASGQELLFQNFYYVQPGFGSVQMVYWSIPADATLAAYRAGTMLSSVQLGE